MGEKQRNINDMVNAICDEIGDSKKDKIRAALEEHLSGWFYTLWHWDDIKQQAGGQLKPFNPEILTDKQCQEIEDFILHEHNAEVGICWDVIQCAIDEVAPDL